MGISWMQVVDARVGLLASVYPQSLVVPYVCLLESWQRLDIMINMQLSPLLNARLLIELLLTRAIPRLCDIVELRALYMPASAVHDRRQRHVVRCQHGTHVSGRRIVHVLEK